MANIAGASGKEKRMTESVQGGPESPPEVVAAPAEGSAEQGAQAAAEPESVEEAASAAEEPVVEEPPVEAAAEAAAEMTEPTEEAPAA